MCGICGKVALRDAQIDPAVVEQMAGTLLHRGPDDAGMYIGEQVVLGHRRLSIIDLNTGKQPISNEDRTVWIVFNGEIYNFKTLRSFLIGQGHVFSTNTDTEVIVHLYEQYGEDCVSKLRGMFAFALWDVRQRKLLLARDRVGIKPLYYSLTPDSLMFGSEIKALTVDPSFTTEVNPQTIDKFLTCFYTPGGDTLFRNVCKLEPGYLLVLQDGELQIKQYWDLRFDDNTDNRNLKTTTDNLVELLRETVRDHMISDVPVGVLLSGGVDSTGLLSFAVEQTDKDVSTFTIGFEGGNFADERAYAKLAATQFGSKHYEMTITPEDFLDFLPKYIWHMEEPVCEPPAVALYYITKLAKEHVKVLISGEGGDEAFAGYQNYRNMVWLERLKAMGKPWVGAASAILNQLSRVRALGKLEKYSLLMKVPFDQYYYTRTSSPFSVFNQLKAELYSSDFSRTVDSQLSLEPLEVLLANVRGRHTLSRMLYVDTKTWLPDDLLVKADKISMANSIELRVPLLDHKVLEFAAHLPASYKLRGFTTKYILKRAFAGRLPKAILSRKKTGFPVPYESWLQNELRDFTWDILTDRKSVERGYFKKNKVTELLERSGKEGKYAPEIFSLLVLELWHRGFVDGKARQTENQQPALVAQ